MLICRSRSCLLHIRPRNAIGRPLTALFDRNSIIFAIAWTHLFTPFVSADREIEAMPVFGADAPGIRFEPFLSVSSATLAFAQQYDGLKQAPNTFRLDTT